MHVPQRAAASEPAGLGGSALSRILTGAPGAKKGQLPAFAAILSEESIDADPGGVEAEASAHPDALHHAKEGAGKLVSGILPEKASAGVAEESAAAGHLSSTKSRTLKDQASFEPSPAKHDKKRSGNPDGALVASGMTFTASAALQPMASGNWAAAHSRNETTLGGAASQPHIPVRSSGDLGGLPTVLSKFADRSTWEAPSAAPVASDKEPPHPNEPERKLPIVSHAAQPALSDPSAAGHTGSAQIRAVVQNTNATLAARSSDGAAPEAASIDTKAIPAAAAPSQTTEQLTGRTQGKAEGKAGGISPSLAAHPSADTKIPMPDALPAQSSAPGPITASRQAEISGAALKPSAAADANTFQRLDAGSAPPVMLHAGAHQIAVGVHDPALGWVEVETRASAGHVSATLMAASAQAHASLAAQAPAITQYLAERNLPVHSVNVQAQAGTQGGTDGGGQSYGGKHEQGTAFKQERSESGGSSLDEADGEMPSSTARTSRISIRA